MSVSFYVSVQPCPSARRSVSVCPSDQPCSSVCPSISVCPSACSSVSMCLSNHVPLPVRQFPCVCLSSHVRLPCVRQFPCVRLSSQVLQPVRRFPCVGLSRHVPLSVRLSVSFRLSVLSCPFWVLYNYILFVCLVLLLRVITHITRQYLLGAVLIVILGVKHRLTYLPLGRQEV